MRSIAFLAASVFCSLASGQVIVLDVSGAKPGTYYYAVQVGSDGRATLLPLNQTVVQVGGNPAAAIGSPAVAAPAAGIVPAIPVRPSSDVPPPPPAQAPAGAGVQGQAQAIIAAALDGAGKLTTAMGLQRGVSAVAGALDGNALAADSGSSVAVQVLNAIVQRASDPAFETSADRLKGLILEGQRAGKFATTKEGCTFLRLVEQGIKDAITGLAQSRGNAVLDSIDFTALKQMELRAAEVIRSQGLQ